MKSLLILILSYFSAKNRKKIGKRVAEKSYAETSEMSGIGNVGNEASKPLVATR